MDEKLSHNVHYVYFDSLGICIKKARHFGKMSKNMTVAQQQEFVRKIMSINLEWYHTMEQMRNSLLSKLTEDIDGLRIHQTLLRRNIEISLVTKVDELRGIYEKDRNLMLPDTPKTKLYELKAILYYATARETQRIKCFNKSSKQIGQVIRKLNVAASDRNSLLVKLHKAVEINQGLENKVKILHNAADTANLQLLKATRSAEEMKAVLEIAEAENKALMEELQTKDSELLQLRQCVASTEEISRQLRQQIKVAEGEIHRQTQLLNTAINENDKLRHNQLQLTTENEQLKTEMSQLKEKLNQQSELMEEQKNVSKSPKEMTAAEGSYDDGPSGYPKDIFTDTVDDKYLCARCTLILKNPIQSFCGHRFCKDCFDRLIREGEGSAICHRCSEESEDAAENTLEQSKTFPDNAIRREMYPMRAKCVYKKCNWSGNFKEYEEHFEKCDWCPRQCDTCQKKMTKYSFDGHSCQTSTLGDGQECKYQCGMPVMGSDIELHLKHFLPEHFEALFRRLENVTSFVGSCSLSPGRQRTLSDWITSIENVVNSLEDNNMQKQPESSVSNRTNNMDRQNQINEGGPWKSSTSGSLAEVAEGGAAGGAKAGSLVTLTQTPQMNHVAQKLVKLSTDMKMCESLLTSLDREVEHDFKVTEALRVNEATLKLNIESHAQKLKSIDRVLSLKNASLADLDKRVSDLEQTCYDGSLLWRVTEFRRRRQEAVSGRTTSIYSPPFYTSKTGFKMCARLYLNGDGMGRGTHVSLFFVIMRGQYDALLKWPFRQKVTLMFLDQSGRDQNVMDAFRPDPTSSSFKRPTTEMNIASGCPLFMALTQLDSPFNVFVKDDTAFIRITISRDEIQT